MALQKDRVEEMCVLKNNTCFSWVSAVVLPAVCFFVFDWWVLQGVLFFLFLSRKGVALEWWMVFLYREFVVLLGVDTVGWLSAIVSSRGGL
jgi:hypothetical protein